MHRKIFAASLTALLAHATATAGPPPLPTAPNGPWTVDFADSMCILSRAYGKDRATTLMLKPSMVGDDLEIIVTRARSSVVVPVYGKAVLTVAGNKVDDQAHFAAYTSVEARVLRIIVDKEKITLAGVRDTLAIHAGREYRQSFAVPGIERALPMLATCATQLRAAYKVSEADVAGIVTEPVGRVAEIFSTKDYPTEAVRNGQYGTIGVLVWIETSGRISTCEIIESNAAAVLEQTTCDLLKMRARFTPARDAAGNAVRAPSFARIRWQLPT